MLFSLGGLIGECLAGISVALLLVLVSQSTEHPGTLLHHPEGHPQRLLLGILETGYQVTGSEGVAGVAAEPRERAVHLPQRPATVRATGRDHLAQFDRPVDVSGPVLHNLDLPLHTVIGADAHGI